METSRAGAVAAALTLCMGNALAEEEPAAEADRTGSAETGYFEQLGPSHRWLSRGLGNLSRRLDAYFGSEDIHDEVSGSHAEIVVAPRLADEGQSDLDGDFRLKLDLPQAERRLQLLLENDSDERQAEGSRLDQGPADPSEDDDETDLFGGLRQILIDTTGVQLQTDLGIKLRTPLDPFARADFRRFWETGPWSVRFKEGLFWFNSSGFGQIAELNLDRVVGEDTAVRTDTTIDWRNDSDELRLSLGVALLEVLNSRETLAYETGMQASNRPTLRAERYRVGLRFRRRLHKDWLFLGVIPEVIWRREDGFTPEPGIRLQVEFRFGERYLAKRGLTPDAGSPEDRSSAGGGSGDDVR